ncbi:MAG: DNA alkylation repair protein [Candidatus Azobacteroides sp.]|nr:DNA alkylation repair protein [Candidatus Azobacteroides sp.]
MNAEFILHERLSIANPEKARFLQEFFKTGKGQYAEGDVMLGIVVPHTPAIAEKLLYRKHDLMHKAVGWMLREVGKKDRETLVDFPETHRAKMPRTTLRYSIERFSPKERNRFMKKPVNGYQ